MNQLPKPKPDPGPGFRLLNVGEIIDKDDEFQLSPTQWSKITEPDKYTIGCKWGGAFVPFRRRVTQESEVETLRMQLAACGVAALDASESQSIKPGSPYYTAAYEDILRLRRYADSAQKAIEDMRRLLQTTWGAVIPCCSIPGCRSEPWTGAEMKATLRNLYEHNLNYPSK